MFIPIFLQTPTQSTKSFMLTCLACLIALGGLSGCQTTGGMTATSTHTSTPSNNIPVLSNDASLPEYNHQTAPSNSHATDENEGSNEVGIIVDEPHSDINNLDEFQSQSESSPEIIQEHINETSPDVPFADESQNYEDMINEDLVTDNEPYAPSVIKSPPPDTKTIQERLLEQARQNSQLPTTSANTIQNGDNIPAFKKLMDTGVSQLRNGQISSAQSTFTRAQRLAPQSSAVYFYLGQVALKQNQPLKAEAMARRGLVVAQTSARKRALWQVVLKAGQAQGNVRVIKEATKALAN